MLRNIVSHVYIGLHCCCATRARTSASIRSAPAKRNASAQTDKVAPVVITSSISKTFFATFRCLRISNTPRWFSYLSVRFSPSCEGVAVFRIKRSGTSGTPEILESWRANSADWLYFRFKRRRQCSGTGTMISARCSNSSPDRAIQLASGLTISSLSPCFKLRTTRRPPPLYTTAARPASQCGGSRRQVSHFNLSPKLTPGRGAPHTSQIAPAIKVVFDQHSAQRLAPWSVNSVQVKHRGG